MVQEAAAEGFLGMRVTMSDGATETLNQYMQLTVGEKLVIMLHGLEHANKAELSTSHPRVRMFWWNMLSTMKDLARAEQHRNRPIKSIRKSGPAPVPGLPHGHQLCPACQNDPDRVPLCDTCDGDGTIAREAI